MAEEQTNTEPQAPKSETFTLVVGDTSKIGTPQTLSELIFPLGDKVQLMALTFKGSLKDYLLQGLRSGLMDGEDILNLACWGMSDARHSYELASQAMQLYHMVGGKKDEVRQAVAHGFGPDLGAVKLSLVPFMKTIVENEDKLVLQGVDQVTIGALKVSLEKWSRSLEEAKKRAAMEKMARTAPEKLEKEAAPSAEGQGKTVQFPGAAPAGQS